MPEAVARRCSAKKLFLKILQNSQENTCVGVSFSIKLKASGNSVFFSVNFAKMLRAHFYLISVKSSSAMTHKTLWRPLALSVA